MTKIKCIFFVATKTRSLTWVFHTSCSCEMNIFVFCDDIMIVITDRPGQMANLLFVYANFLAYGIEKKVSIYNPAFYSYRDYFTLATRPILPVNQWAYKNCERIIYRLLSLGVNNKLIGSKKISLEEHTDLEDQTVFRPSLIFFVAGWPFRSNRLVLIHQEKIRAFFRPRPSFQNQINEFFQTNFPNKEELKIGIHIRRGDYKDFLNGKYFYSVSQYEEIIERLLALFPSMTIHFLIASPENLDHSHFTNKNLRLSFAPGHQLLDLYCLARCNFIVGPPSTYSMWASFFGKVPLYKIEDINESFGLSDFSVQEIL